LRFCGKLWQAGIGRGFRDRFCLPESRKSSIVWKISRSRKGGLGFYQVNKELVHARMREYFIGQK
jgi:hypothetical protein